MLICADARAIPLRDNSIDCVVTSPPYWALRKYDIDGPGEIGLEATPDEFVDNIVQVFREVRRVLAPHGTLWLNIGDCYATGAGTSGEDDAEQGARWASDVDRVRDSKRGYRGDRLANGRGDHPAIKRKKTRADRDGTHAGKNTAITALGPMTQPNRLNVPGLKAKDMVGIPWRVAFALQADGWWLRKDIIWNKPNPMPESVKDRPTSAHEYLFLFARSETYYFDRDAVKEPASPDTHARYARARSDSHKYAGASPMPGQRQQTIARTFEHMRRPGVGPKAAQNAVGSKQNDSFSAAVKDVVEDRNIRSVWTIATQPYPGAHFATFPEELPDRCIRAGCPVKVCAQCGAPFEPVVDVEYRNDTTTDGRPARGNHRPETEGEKSTFASGERTRRIATHRGYARACDCGEAAGYRPGRVLDPFIGSGTTVKVATELGRDGIGLDLSLKYLTGQAKQRIRTTRGFVFDGAV